MGTRQSNKSAEYTERGILDILNRQFLVSPRWIINNLYVYNWESDYLAITRSMYAYEVEVKISLADYNKDFEKEGKHQVMQGWFEARKDEVSLLPLGLHYPYRYSIVTTRTFPIGIRFTSRTKISYYTIIV